MTFRDGPPGATPSDADLVRAHVAGDPAAFAEIVRRHRDRLWAVALRTIGDREEAADAVQDALLNAQVDLPGMATRADYFAYYGGDGPNGAGTKAAVVGWLLAVAETENVGLYAKANHAYLTDLLDGTAPYHLDIIGTYGRPVFNYGG